MDSDTEVVVQQSFSDFQQQEEEDLEEVVPSYSNMQEKFFEVIDLDEVEDAIDLNAKFLSMNLGRD